MSRTFLPQRAALVLTSVACIAATVIGVAPGFSGVASAAPISFNLTSNAGQIILKEGDATNQRTITNPAVTMAGTVDDQTGATTASATFQPTFTPNQAGPFGLVLYIKAEILQVTPFTGTLPASGAIDMTGSSYLAITVYRTTTGTVGQSNGQNPATDQVLANGATCRSLLSLHVQGAYDFSARTVHMAEDPFAIPNFPADTRSTGGNAGCGSATTSLNSQLAGPTNSLTLTFGGTIAGHVPSAPGLLTPVAGNGQVTLDGPEPSDYGSPITSYTVTPYLLGVAQPSQVVPAAGPPVITGLVNGQTYTFTAAATNGNGTGPVSPQSSAVTVGAPTRPGFQSATAGPGNAQVQWFPPADNGSPILGYTITPYVAGVAQTPQQFVGNGNVRTVTGLTPGTTYTFVIAAKNVFGTGAASAPTNAVVPA